MQADRHAFSRRGKQRTGKVRHRCYDACQTCTNFVHAFSRRCKQRERKSQAQMQLYRLDRHAFSRRRKLGG